MDIPSDADGDAMRRVIDSGSDPSKPMAVDFMIDCPDLSAAEVIASLASARGYTTKIVEEDEDEGEGVPFITCYCSKRMLLDYNLLVAAQEELDVLAKPSGGFIDGWGTFGNAE